MAQVNKTGIVAVTTNDTTTYNPPLKRLWAGVTGTVTVVDVNGNTALLTGFPAGSWVKFHNSPVQIVKATGTSATGIVGDTNPEN